jgi:hypothetical protein
MDTGNYDRFKNLTYEGHRKLAIDDSLSRYEKIGFPNSYREGYEPAIFADILTKLTVIEQQGQTILDIGPGCSELPRMLIEKCRKHGHTLLLVDSPEMLDQLPNEPFIIKTPGFFPNECSSLLEKYAGKINAILTYSVLQCVFIDTNIFTFMDKALSLLAEQGQFLVGDIPNNSKRKRFFSSRKGILHHQEFTGTDEIPRADFNVLEFNKIDDTVVMALIMRTRSAGFDSYLVQQALDLPMANRREDILIIKP